MLRYVTAGESHGQLLTAIIEGVPAHVSISTAELASGLARRRLGAGRGARMAFERDDVRITGGVRHGLTLGGPVAIEVANTEWGKWETVMAADAVDPAVLAGLARNEALTRPRPGHADLAGMQKFGFAEARPVLERASARETAARVAAGEVARAFLRQGLGIQILSHVVSIGGIARPDWQFGGPPRPAEQAVIDADPVRCADPALSEIIQERIAEAAKAGDTLGGVAEVVAWNVPPGLGTHVSAPDRLDARLAGACMGIPSVKGVEIGDGFALADAPGSAAHDRMRLGGGRIVRMTNRAGGIEGGISNGECVRVRVAFKPIATLAMGYDTVDVATGAEARSHHQRSDVCAVPAGAVVAEAMVAMVLAQAALEKFGGDTLGDVRAAVGAYRQRLDEAGLGGTWGSL